jgi:hypothetical protein
MLCAATTLSCFQSALCGEHSCNTQCRSSSQRRKLKLCPYIPHRHAVQITYNVQTRFAKARNCHLRAQPVHDLEPRPTGMSSLSGHRVSLRSARKTALRTSNRTQTAPMEHRSHKQAEATAPITVTAPPEADHPRASQVHLQCRLELLDKSIVAVASRVLHLEARNFATHLVQGLALRAQRGECNAGQNSSERYSKHLRIAMSTCAI